MTIAIASLVKTLGDFPLDAQAGLGWIWSADGRRLLWASPKAMDTFGLATTGSRLDFAHADALRSIIADLALPDPDLEPVRVLQLTLVSPDHQEMFMCLARAVPMVDGPFGILAVAVGAPARSLEAINAVPAPAATDDVRSMPLTDTASAPPVHAEPAVAAVAPVRSEDTPLPRQSRPPGWTTGTAAPLRPLRFVWQTDEQGRFVHLSRELAEAVGLGHAIALGQTWQETAARNRLADTGEIDAGFASRETWTARAILWPVDESDLGIPVELAGMPVREGDVFVGFRGYGIARIERAIKRPGNALDALASDKAPETEQDSDRFGPAVARALTLSSAPLPVALPDQAPAQSTAQSLPGIISPTIVPPTVNPAMPARRPLGLSDHIDGTGMPAVHALQKALDESRLNIIDPVRPGGTPKSLTDHERRAFRDIARALGSSPDEGARQIEAPSSLKSVTPDLPSLPSPAERQTVIPFEPAVTTRNHLKMLPAARDEIPGLLEKLPLGLLVMQDGRISFANRTLLDMLDYANSEDLLKAVDGERLFGSNPSHGRTGSRTFELINSKGQNVPVEASIQSISWNGAPATLTSFLPARQTTGNATRDALELDMLSARAELRELKFVLDTATDGIISLNGEGRILGLNRSAEALFGFDQNEIAGESITTLLAPESHAAALDYLEGLKINGVASIMNDGRDVMGRERHGGAIPLFMTLGRLGDDSRAQRFCAVLRDVTAWKKAEADLQEAKRTAEDANANKTEFLARISHEVRTPLNAILGFSQVMMAETLGPVGNPKYAQYARDIHASGQHVLSLVNDLLDLSKINSGKLDLAFGSVDIAAVAGECVAMIQPQATAGKIIVRSQIASRLPPVVADDRSLRQILLNLLSNAIRFTEPGGQVIVSATFNQQGEVVVRVRDTGIGMDDEELKSVMEPFRQVAGPRSSGGTGLGLPLTKALVEANRATFTLSSERHKGTLAEVVFPSTRVLAE